MAISRTIDVVVRPTPEELADAFWSMCSDEQAEFFNRLGVFDRLCFQLHAIAYGPALSVSGRHAMARIGEYSTEENNHGRKTRNDL